ncbi:MAG: hypothetical protein QW101_05120 [Ignisphaera sp.]|uniref:Uncharacterized protein n=1 Tax=Ignisphaera aggregans TaxID=334771 RepID=A0A7J3N0U4_9CREN
MVYEFSTPSELRDHISKNRLAVIAIANKDRESVWQYVKDILNKLELSAKPSIAFAIVHYQSIGDELESFEIEQARKSAIIKLFLNGSCIFEQEGLLGSRTNDEIVLKRGIKETLKTYSIEIRFTSP